MDIFLSPNYPIIGTYALFLIFRNHFVICQHLCSILKYINLLLRNHWNILWVILLLLARRLDEIYLIVLRVIIFLRARRFGEIYLFIWTRIDNFFIVMISFNKFILFKYKQAMEVIYFLDFQTIDPARLPVLSPGQFLSKQIKDYNSITKPLGFW